MTTLFDVPEGAVMPAAECSADFDCICAQLNATPKTEYITYSRKLKKPKLRYRYIGLKLDSGRVALLLKMDNDNCFQIWMQRKGYGYRSEDLQEVIRFVAVGESEVRRLDNGFTWH